MTMTHYYNEYDADCVAALRLEMSRGRISVRLGRRRNRARIKQLGNAWCPQVAAAVLRAWMIAEDQEASPAAS